MSLPILRGREFTVQDREGGEAVVVVNETLAQRLWPGEDPVGKRLRWLEQPSDTRWVRVVGLTRDVKQFGLEKSDHPAAYAPYRQRQFPWLRWMSFVVHSSGDAATLTNAMRDAVKRADPDLPVFAVATLEGSLARSLAPRRFSMTLVAILAGLALALGLVGLYGVVSYLVILRRRDLAIRMALGATSGRLYRMVLKQAVALTASGLTVGLVSSMALARYLKSLLFGITPYDVWTLAGVCALVSAAALMASFGPARRASRVDPAVLLRE
jgi:predicted permease